MLVAVHLADGVLSYPWLAAGWAAAGVLVAVGLVRLSEEHVPRVGLLTAALFVASQLHVPVAVGSVHLLLNAVAGVLLGRRVGVAVFVALTFQALLFAHGGFYTLGVNTAVVGLPALAGAGLYRVLRGRLRPLPCGVLVGTLVSTATVAGNGLIVWLGMPQGGRAAAVALVLLHLPVVAVEGAGTGVLLAYLAAVKPEWIGRAGQSAGVTSANGTSH